MPNRSTRRAQRWSRGAVAALSVCATAVLAAPAASASPLDSIPGAEHCDVDLDGACVSVAIEGGTFDNNGFQLPINEGDMNLTVEVLESGQFASRDTTNFGVYAKPMTVPGGVLGFDLPLNNFFGLAAVTAQVQAVSTPVALGDLFDFNIDLPVRLKLNNPFLGGNCYLGTAENPVKFELRGLTDGDNASQMSVVGGPEYPEGTLKATNVNNIAQDFAIPSATGCGPFGALNPIVNWRAKTPATTGTSLRTTSTAYLYVPGDLVATPSPEDPAGAGSSGSAGSLGSLGS